VTPTRRNITGRGVVVGCAALVLVLAGFLLGHGGMITLGGCGLMILGGCFVMAPRNLRDLELEVRLPPRFFAMRNVTAVVELHNRRRAGNAWRVEVSVRFPHKVERSGHAPWTPAMGSSLRSERLSIPVRGGFQEVDVEIRSRFPLGLFRVHRSDTCRCPVVVYPQLITPVELQWEGLQTDPNPTAGAAPGDLFGEPRGIRPYQPGDKATRIHHFASARSLSRGQGLQARAYDPPGFHPDRCRIVFHSYAKAGEVIRFDRFERGLSLVAGTLCHFQTNQTKVTLQADFAGWRSWPCETRAQYLECLALLTRTERARQTKAHELVEVLQATPATEQLIIISDSPPEQWADLVPLTHHRAILVNIRQVRFERRQFQPQPANAHR